MASKSDADTVKSKKYSEVYDHGVLEVNASNCDVVSVVGNMKAIILKSETRELFPGYDTSEQESLVMTPGGTEGNKRKRNKPIDTVNCDIPIEGKEDSQVFKCDKSNKGVKTETAVEYTWKKDKQINTVKGDIPSQDEEGKKELDCNTPKKGEQKEGSMRFIPGKNEETQGLECRTSKQSVHIDSAKINTLKQGPEILAIGSDASGDTEQKETARDDPSHEDAIGIQKTSNSDVIEKKECVTVATYEDRVELNGYAARGTRFDIKVEGNKFTQIGDGCKVNLMWGSNQWEMIEIDFNDFKRTIILDDPWRFPTALRRFGSCQGAKYENLMKTMRIYQDNGMHAEMDRFKDECLEKFRRKDDIDMQVVVLAQHAVMGIYRSDVGNSLNQLMEALKLAEKAKNHQYLIGMCLVLIAYAYAKDANDDRDHDTILHYLNEAEVVLKFYVSDEMKARLNYVYGLTLEKKLAICSSPSEEDELKALESFYLDARHMAESNDPDLIQKRRHWSILKQIRLYLRSYLENFMMHPVKKANLRKAKDLLDEFEIQHWSDASKGARTYFFALRADYFGRMGQIGRGLEILNNEGGPTAQQVGHKSLMDMIEKRKIIFHNLLKNKVGREANLFKH